MGSKKILALSVIILLVAGFFIYLNFEKVTVLKIDGTAAITGFPTEYITLYQYGLAPKISAKFVDVSRLSYIFEERGKPRVVASKQVKMPDVVNLTIIFILKTPTNKTIEFQPLKLGAGGVHNFTIIVGPDEGLRGDGRFYLMIIFKLLVKSPTGRTIVDLERRIIVEFELPAKNISVHE